MRSLLRDLFLISALGFAILIYLQDLTSNIVKSKGISSRQTMQTSTSKPSSSSTASKPRKRFVGSKAGPSKRTYSPIIANQIPQDILEDSHLNAAIKQLPSNYSFEIHKTIHHVRKNNATMVALQMPEGLQMFACTIADIIERYADD